MVSLNLYPILAEREDLLHIGGAEKQLSLIARELAARGYSVSIVSWDFGQQDGASCHGIRVFRSCRTKQGLPGLRALHPRMTSLWAAMGRADADVYVQRTADEETGLVAAWCRLHGRRFVYCAASDSDCHSDLPRLHSCRSRLLYRYGLKNADRVVVQSRRQQLLLREQFGIDARIVSPCGAPLADDDNPGIVHEPHPRPRVLWVGRFCRVKRLEALLHVAELCPDLEFDVVGAPLSADAYTDALCREAALLPNVTLHGFVPPAQIGKHYRSACLLVCTSEWEGFPNTFLEAWSAGIPTVSTFDPDGVIARNRLGAVAADVSSLAAAIRALVTDRFAWKACSIRAREYFRAHHGLGMAVNAYERLFTELERPARQA